MTNVDLHRFMSSAENHCLMVNPGKNASDWILAGMVFLFLSWLGFLVFDIRFHQHALEIIIIPFSVFARPCRFGLDLLNLFHKIVVLKFPSYLYRITFRPDMHMLNLRQRQRISVHKH